MAAHSSDHRIGSGLRPRGSPPVRRSQTSAAATLRAVEQCRSSMARSPGHQLADPDHQQWPPHNAQICAAGAARGIDAATAPNTSAGRRAFSVSFKLTQCDRCHSVPQLERDPTTDLEAVLGPCAIDAAIRRLTPAAWIPAWSGALYAAEAEVHAERWRCIKIRPSRCLRHRGRDCLPSEELRITARRAAALRTRLQVARWPFGRRRAGRSVRRVLSDQLHQPLEPARLNLPRKTRARSKYRTTTGRA